MTEGGEGMSKDSERRHEDKESRCNQDSCDAASVDQETVTHALLQDAGRRLHPVVLLVVGPRRLQTCELVRK